jgi:hypothetical protein
LAEWLYLIIGKSLLEDQTQNAGRDVAHGYAANARERVWPWYITPAAPLILLIGQFRPRISSFWAFGGREQASGKLPRAERLFCAAGNAGITKAADLTALGRQRQASFFGRRTRGHTRRVHVASASLCQERSQRRSVPNRLRSAVNGNIGGQASPRSVTVKPPMPPPVMAMDMSL